MASAQLKAKRIPAAPAERRHGLFAGEPARARRAEAPLASIRYDFAAPAEPAAQHRRAIGWLAVLTLAATGMAAALVYFAGIVATAIVAAAAGALVALGNWILNHTIARH